MYPTNLHMLSLVHVPIKKDGRRAEKPNQSSQTAELARGPGLLNVKDAMWSSPMTRLTVHTPCPWLQFLSSCFVLSMNQACQEAKACGRAQPRAAFYRRT